MLRAQIQQHEGILHRVLDPLLRFHSLFGFAVSACLRILLNGEHASAACVPNGPREAGGARAEFSGDEPISARWLQLVGDQAMAW